MHHRLSPHFPASSSSPVSKRLIGDSKLLIGVNMSLCHLFVVHTGPKGCLSPCPSYFVLKSALSMCFWIHEYISVVHRDLKNSGIEKSHGYLPYAFPCNTMSHCCVCVEPKATSLSGAAPLCLSMKPFIEDTRYKVQATASSITPCVLHMDEMW